MGRVVLGRVVFGASCPDSLVAEPVRLVLEVFGACD